MTSGGSIAGDGKRPSELIGPWFLRRVGYRKVITSRGYRVSEGPRSGPMKGAGFTGCPHTHIAHLWIDPASQPDSQILEAAPSPLALSNLSLRMVKLSMQTSSLAQWGTPLSIT